MSSIIQSKLNLVPGESPGGVLPRVRVSQGDAEERILKFEIYDGTAAADLSGVTAAYIGGRKPDNHAFTCTCTISGNVATVPLSIQSTACAGIVLCKFYLIYDDGSVRSVTFELDVDPDPLADADYSETEVPDIINLARVSAESAAESAANAAAHETNAAASATAAANSATAAATSESNAAASATAAKTSEDNAKASETAASNSQTAAANSATAAANSATAAANSKNDSEAWAIGERNGVPVASTDETYNNNSKYYSEVAQQAAAGGLIPQGTVTFANLPPIADAKVGDLWNISDSFTTTADFREGAGEYYGPGADVYKTADGYWDVLADVPQIMTGATASADGTAGECAAPQAGDQNNYWAGDASWKSDTSKLTAAFTSSDNTGETGIITASGGETSMSGLASGQTHGTLFEIISKVALNTRKLINTAKRVWNTIGATWVTGRAYAVNDMVLYTNGHMYRCKTAHTSSNSVLPTNTTYWEDTTVATQLAVSLKGIASLNSNFANTFLLASNPTFTSVNNGYVATKNCLMMLYVKNNLSGGTYAYVTSQKFPASGNREYYAAYINEIVGGVGTQWFPVVKGDKITVSAASTAGYYLYVLQ